MATPSNLVIKVGLDTASVTTQKAALTAEFKDLQSQLTALAKEFQKAGESVDELGNSVKGKLLAQMELLSPQVNAAKSAIASLVPAMEQVEHSSSGVRRELIVLGHELAMGNYSRLGGSLSVLAERMGNVGTGALGAAGGVAGLAVILYELAERQKEVDQAIRTANGSLLMAGSLTADAAAETRAWIEELNTGFNVSIGDATKAVDAIRGVGGAAGASQHGLLQLAEAISTLHPDDDFSKIAEEVAKAANGGSESLLKFIEASHGLSEAQIELIKPLVESGNETVALGKIIEDINSNFADQALKVAAARAELDKYHATMANMVIMGAGADGFTASPEQFGITAPKPEELEIKPQGPPRNLAIEQELAAVARLNPVLEQTAKAYDDIRIAQAAEDAGVPGAADAQATAWRELSRIKSESDTQAHEKILANLQEQMARTKENAAAGIQVARQMYEEQVRFYGAESPEARSASLEIVRQQQDAARQGMEETKRADEEHQRALEAQLRTLQEAARLQERGSPAQVTAAQRTLTFAQQNFPAGSAQQTGAQSELADALKAQASIAAEIRLSDLNATVEINKAKLEAAKAELQAEVSEGSISAAQRIAQLKALTAAELAEDQTRLQAQLETQQAGTVAFENTLNEMRKLRAQFDLDMVQLDKQAAQQSGKAWEDTNKSIGSALASAITSGGKGGFGAAIGNYLKESLTKGLGDVFTNSLGSIEKLIGLGGTSPGGLLQSGLSAIGLGGVGKFIGLGGDAAGAGGQAAATAGLTTAATGLNTSAVSLNTAGVALNTAAAALTTAAAASGASSAIGAASGSGGIAADAVKFAFNDLTPFAAGTSYVPRTMPALIHAGEMVIPAMQAATLRSGGSLDFSGLHYSPPAALTNISAGRTGLSQSNFSSSVDNSRGDTHNYNFRQTNHVQTASDADHASEISRMSSRELQRFVRQNMK